MKLDKSFDGRSCQEDWDSFDSVSVPDRDDLSRTVKGRALSSSALMTGRETQTIQESPRDSNATACIPVLEAPPVTAVVMDQIRNAVAEEIIASLITSFTQKVAENIPRAFDSQVKEPEPYKNVQDRDFVAPIASKVPPYIEMKNQTLSLDDTSSVQQYCIGTTRQGRHCKDTAERDCKFCRGHLWQAEAATGSKIDPPLPAATLVQCVAVSKAGTRCVNAAGRKGAAHCGKHLPGRDALTGTIHQCRGFSTRGNRCENAAKKGFLFCGGRHLPSRTTTVAKPATPSKAVMFYGRNGMPPTFILATKKMIAINQQMCVGPSCRDMAKKGSLYCRHHSSLPAIPVLVTNGRCVAITNPGKQFVDPTIRGTSYCFNHSPCPSGVCAAVTKAGKLCVDPTVGGTLFCHNHTRHLATSLVVKTQAAPPPRTSLVQTPAVNNGGQLLAALINCLPQQVRDGIPTAGGRAGAGAGSFRRCKGLTEAGKRCKDTAKKSSPFCGRHSTGTNHVGTDDVMMSQLIGYIDGKLDSIKRQKY
jgi:hypothetical protein